MKILMSYYPIMLSCRQNAPTFAFKIKLLLDPSNLPTCQSVSDFQTLSYVTIRDFIPSLHPNLSPKLFVFLSLAASVCFSEFVEPKKVE